MTAPRYVPGTAHALLLGPVVALVDGEEPVVEDLWAAVVEGGDLTTALSVIVRPGLDRLPAFALASLEDGRLHAFVHGDVEVVVETSRGVQSHDGRRISTWSETLVEDVVRVTLQLMGTRPSTGTASALEPLPLIGGIVVASQIEVVAPTHRDAGLPLAQEGDDGPGTEPEAADGRAEADAAEPVQETAEDVPQDLDTTDTRAHELDVDTGVGVPGGVDGRTVLSSELVEIRRRLPHWPDDAVPGPFPVPGTSADPDRAVARIVLSTGAVVALDRRVLLGRSPMVSRAADSGDVPRLVTVESPHRDVSRTHAEVRADATGVTVTDLHSTNGVYLDAEGEGVVRLRPGEPTVVPEGTTVDLGDGVSFVVESD